MSIYSTKTRWKWGLSLVVTCIIAVTLWFNNRLVHKFIADEQKNLIIWADAVQHRAKLVESTETFFKKLQEEEYQKVQMLAHATRMLIQTESSADQAFYLSIISNNTTIPVIQTDKNFHILSARNVDFNVDTVHVLQGNLKQEFSEYNPIEISSFGVINYIFYKDSKHFTELKNYLDVLMEDFFSQTVINSASMPVIITDSTCSYILNTTNIPPQHANDTTYLLKTIKSMYSASSPIKFTFSDNTNFIFYSESQFIETLKKFPIIQMLIIFLFFIISYFLFNSARRSEENKVWAGLAKETAHQLGTPLSSIMAWTELLKMNNQNEIADEINKDVARLKTITDRFSKIGSVPKLLYSDIYLVIENSTNYLKKRTSDKITFIINKPDTKVMVPISNELFEWVVENLCKNAIDAMNGKGIITIDIYADNKYCFIDVSDTGKGIPRSKQKTIFNPGFTTKTRGWGLGLSLVKRIIENIHNGKIFVKSSTLNKGTTFRIILKLHK